MPQPDVTSDQIINMTTHVLHIYEGGRLIRTIQPTRRPARAVLHERGEFEVGGVSVERISYGELNIPEPAPGVWFVVSQVAKLILLARGIDRPDVLIPGPGVSERGRVVGSRGLVQVEPQRRGQKGAT